MDQSRQTIFHGGQIYYVFFIYAKPSTYQTYDIYVGPKYVEQLTVTPIRANLPAELQFHTVPGGGWVLPPKPDKTKGVVPAQLNLCPFCRPGPH